MAEKNPNLKWTVIYLVVCFLPVLAFFLSTQAAGIIHHRVVNNYLIYAPDLCLLLVAILGWQINQTRAFWASLALWGLYHYLLQPTSLFALETTRVKSFEITAVAFPLFLAILFSIKESKLFSDQTLTRLLLALCPFIFLTALYAWAPDIPPKVFFWNILSSKFAVWPDVTLLSLAILGLVFFFMDDAKIKPFLTAILTTLIPLYLALYVSLIPGAVTLKTDSSFHVILSMTALSAVLLHSILHTYWRRVYLDALTGIPNRQALDERLHTLSGAYALAMVDIDHFKKFNDTYGHEEGDNVLRMVAQHLQSHLGPKAFRYGGEEFCVVFEGVETAGAEKLMEETREGLEKRKFTIRARRRRKGESERAFKARDGGSSPKITISVGVALAGAKTTSSHQVIKKADQALYQAKDRGRNRIVMAE